MYIHVQCIMQCLFIILYFHFIIWLVFLSSLTISDALFYFIFFDFPVTTVERIKKIRILNKTYIMSSAPTNLKCYWNFYEHTITMPFRIWKWLQCCWGDDDRLMLNRKAFIAKSEYRGKPNPELHTIKYRWK